MAGNVKLMTSAGGGVVLDTATTTATDVTVKVPVTGVNNGTLVCSDSSGNVGIGTSSPSTTAASGAQNLVIGNSSTSTAGITINTGSGSYVGSLNFGRGLGNSTDNYGYIKTDHSNGFMGFGVGSTERMRIDSSGNLLVNATAQTYGEKLKVVNTDSAGNVGFFWHNSTADRDVIIVRNERASGATSAGMINFKAATGTTVGSISSTGSATSYVTSSDYRLKENIQPMAGALAVVQQLNPVTYTWKADGSDGQGFIAHELQAVVPDCVTGEKDAVDAEGNPVYQGIDTSFLVATLTKAIQELSAKNDALEARIAALEAK